MDVQHKDATITNTDDAGPGSFEVILSAPTKDRDGETLLPDEWKQPLPDHITFDSDHGMTVATTVGSGVPRLDAETGNLVVTGTYSSLPRAQEVRTLVNEGHIRTTSVAFMSEKTEKDGVKSTQRELLNGAFVAIPSNREALVMASKALKAGARNNKSDAEHIQAIHDHALALGAIPGKAKKALDAPDATPSDVTPDPGDHTPVVSPPDEDESPDPAVTSAAAPAQAAAPADSTAADDDELQTRVRALHLSAYTYTD